MNVFPHIKKKYKNNIDWCKYVLIFIGIVFSFCFLFIPLISIFIEALSGGIYFFIKNLNNYEIQHSIFLTLLIAFITIFVNVIFGILISLLLTHFNFFGKSIFFILINLPFAISPVIVGLMYLLTYGINGPIGNFLDQYDIQIIFSLPTMILVTIFITFPFIIMELIPIILYQNKNEEEAAILLGASGWQIFWNITLPKIKLGLLYGIVLTYARSIGEFGAVSIVSGLIRGETYTLPLQIELLYQDYNNIGAFSASALLAIIAIILLFLKRIIQWKSKNYFIK